MPITRHAAELVRDAEAEVECLTPDAAMALLEDQNNLFVDLRDVRELERDPPIPGAFHCPRGMLEFWLDPDSPYHHAELDEPRQLVFYCRAGGRSALAALAAQNMGRRPVAHISGGYSAWREAGGAVDPSFPQRKK